MQPSIGRIVHYLEGEGVTCAALIVAVHPEREATQRFIENPLEPDAEPFPAVDSDGDPIFEGGSSEGDVALYVFRADGTTYLVPVASEHVDPDPDDEDGMGEPQAAGTWVWPPRV